MAKKSAKNKLSVSAAALEPRGKKIVFDAEPSVDGDESEHEQPSGSQNDEPEQVESEENEETDSDDDDAPEAVGFAVDQRKARAEAEAEEARRKAKVERQKQLQSHREAEKKAKATKAAEALVGKASKSAKGKKVVQEDSDEQFGNESGSGTEELSGDEDEAEFHTDSEDDLDADLDEDLDEASDEADEDGEETLEYDETDPSVKRLQARMQKAMEAAERRAMEDDAPPTKKSKSSKTENLAEVVEPAEERSEYDMGPMPLPQSVLRVAAEVDLMRKKAEKRKAEAASSSKSKKRKRRMQREEEDLTTRALNSRTAIQLLPSADSMSSLPPIVAPRAQVSQKTNLDGFRKRAMRRSGLALGAKANARKPSKLYS
ncbi:hypothetical protein NCC49_003462 [Naganishia albida]|nr:hypothetical protein NCC49_003462 [Naganishia albida]